MALVVLLGACGGDREAPAGRTLTVFAAASLVEAFGELAAELERQDSTLEVRLNVAGSQQLAGQLVRGAVADIFAAADREAMQFAAARGLVLEPRVFAHNRLVVVAARQPEVDMMLVDLLNLATPGLKLVLAAPEVPAGRYAREALRNLSGAPGYGPDFADRVLGNVVSDEVNVRAVLTKVRLGEAHAGIVYASDVSGPDSIARREGIRVIPIPDAFGVRAEYVIARLRSVGDSAGAEAFLRLVLGPQGQAVLARYGFEGVGPGR
ncbi:MAG TPA: molybdate ABC transporter substrate-binding protein [Gemmatimonadales bacterium]|nr:molybdate ABC transporter substrate-binding protein [Gemmatimonadales bacterium]